MYEQYTDKQIVEMLVPKLNKAVPGVYWGDCVELPEFNKKIIKAIAIIYRSAYIRGQLGRSFIIGEPKQSEHWVPATEDNVKVGSKVRMIDEEAHLVDSVCAPVVGTMGIVEKIDSRICLVKWPKGTTSDDDKWYCAYAELEVLLCE